MSSQVLILWLVTLIFSVIMGSVNAFIFFKEHDGVERIAIGGYNLVLAVLSAIALVTIITR
jgi:hypothetical protein